MSSDVPCEALQHQKSLRRSSMLKKFINKPDKKNKPLKKKSKIARCQYETIPFPSKYNIQDYILIYGNIPLLQKDSTFCCDFSILNRFHIYRDIKVIPYQDQSVLSIKTERRTDARFSRWKTVLKKISKTKDSKLMKWNKIIKKFSHIYEKQMREYSDERQEQLLRENDPIKQKKMLDLAIEKRENKKRSLMSRYPCIRLKTIFRGFENRLVEIDVNEKLIQALGYKIDSFISTILKEGIPPLFESEENKTNPTFLQNVIKSYCATETYDYQTPEFDIVLLTRSDYAKPAKVQVHFLMNQLEDSYGSDTIFAVICQGIPYLPVESNVACSKLNKSFVERMCSEEKETSRFLSTYYKTSPYFPEYLNLHKTCCIKEVVDMDYICKDEDDP